AEPEAVAAGARRGDRDRGPTAAEDDVLLGKVGDVAPVRPRGRATEDRSDARDLLAVRVDGGDGGDVVVRALELGQVVEEEACVDRRADPEDRDVDRALAPKANDELGDAL